MLNYFVLVADSVKIPTVSEPAMPSAVDMLGLNQPYTLWVNSRPSASFQFVVSGSPELLGSSEARYTTTFLCLFVIRRL